MLAPWVPVKIQCGSTRSLLAWCWPFSPRCRDFCFPTEEADFPGEQSSVGSLDRNSVALTAEPSGLAPP